MRTKAIIKVPSMDGVIIEGRSTMMAGGGDILIHLEEGRVFLNYGEIYIVIPSTDLPMMADPYTGMPIPHNGRP